MDFLDDTSLAVRQAALWLANLLPLRSLQNQAQSRLMRLTADQLEALEAVNRSTARYSAVYDALEVKGAVVTGTGRYGSWARITPSGQAYLARKQAAGDRATSEQVVDGSCSKPSNKTRPAALPGLASTSVDSSSNLLRGVVPRQQRNTTKNARSTSAAIPSPAAAQPVGKTNSTTPRGRK